MSFFRKQGQLTTAASGTAAIAVTGLGFVPKVVIFWWSGDTANGAGTNRLQGGWGWMIDATHRGCVSGILDALSASASVLRTNGCVSVLSTSRADIGVLDFQSMDADGFTVVPTTAFNATRVINYLALGGTDVEATCGSSTLPGTGGGGGAWSVTGLSFAPAAVLLAGTNESNVAGTIDTLSSLSLGWATAAAQAALGSRCMDTTSPTNSRGMLSTGLAFVVPVFDANSIAAASSIDTLTADGFTATQTNGTNNPVVLWLALGGTARYFAGTAAMKTTTGNQAVTGVGFVPAALLAMFRGGVTATQAAPTDGVDTGVGGTDFTAQGAVGFTVLDNVSAAAVSRVSSNTKLLVRSNPTPAVVDDLAIVSADADGFTFDQTTASGVASLLPFLAVAGAAAAGGSAGANDRGVARGVQRGVRRGAALTH